MDKEKLLLTLQNSFLQELLLDSAITDISYNGQSIFYLHNFLGRQKADISVSDSDAKDFIRQIANLSEKQFSFQNPKLDVSSGKYRINAVHPSIGRKDNERCLTFSIRIASEKPIIKNDPNFLNAELVSLFNVLLKSKVSIVIGGITGSGKTEFQKYLIASLENYTRIIIIDNVLELDNLSLDNDLDINVWQSDENNKETTIQELVRNALRSNPDWLIVAESRGKEMIEVLNSAMTGHPILTTIHAFDINSMPTRITRMVMMNEQTQNFDVLLTDIYYSFRFYVYLKREIDEKGRVKRFIDEVAEFDIKGNKTTIYRHNSGKRQCYPLRKEVLEMLRYDNDEVFIKTFIKEKK
ncbi:MAG: type II/IV secretion system ATPase subunit [Bacilli bacterium]|nr:type II/IV secretion system ATPase subunit [Bacilli bacterium]